MTWRITWTIAGSQCTVIPSSVEVDLAFEVYLPRWVDRRGAPWALRKDWDEFVWALANHERGHENNGIEAANELRRRLGSLSAACRSIKVEANSQQRRVL